MILFHNFVWPFLLVKKNPKRFFFSLFLLSFFAFLICFSSTNIFYNNFSENMQDNDEYSLFNSAPPTFSINSPVNYTLYGTIAPDYNITITSGLGNYSWYEFIETGESSEPIALNGIADEEVTGTFDQSLWNNLPNDNVTIRFYVNNSLGEIGQEDAIVRIDIIEPTINIISPTGGYFNLTAPEFTVEIEDPNLDLMWYTLNTNTTKYFFTNNESINQNGWKFLPDGLVDINFYANDSVSNTNSDTIQVTKDTTDPVITINAPVVGVYSGAPAYDITITEDNLDQYWYTLNGDSPIYIASLTGTINSTEWGNLLDGSVEIIFYVNDSAGNENYNSVAVTKDTTVPVITINAPVVGVYYNDAPAYDITITEVNLDQYWYTLDGGSPIYIASLTGIINSTEWGNLLDGSVDIRFYGNDSAGNVGFTDVTVNKDTTDPVITINAPVVGVYNGAPVYDITITEDNLDQDWYTLNGGSPIYITSTTGTINSTEWGNLLDGSVEIIFYANDSAGNVGSNSVTVTKDTTDPVITINAPVVGVYDNAPAYDITITEVNLDQVWYTLDGGSPIYIASLTGIINSTEWGNLPDGSVEIIFYANDDAGNQGSNSVTVTKDTTDPVITINAPITGVYSDAPAYNITITEDNLDQYWYTLNGSSPIYIASTTGTIDPTEWGNLVDGSVEIIFYANDSVGRQGLNTVTVSKDKTDPIITIIAPTPSIYSSAPAYNITITEDNLDQYWYTLNGGSPIYITSMTGTINSTEWGNLPDGSVEIIFYANDDAGNQGSNSVTVNKDTGAPMITIISPTENTSYNEVPDILVSVTDPNFDSTWYCVNSTNGWSNNYSLTNNEAQELNATIWDNLPAEGMFQLFVFANDTLGNLNQTFIILFKDILAPRVRINSPADLTYWNSRPPINVSAYDLNFDYILYQVEATAPIMINNNEEKLLDLDRWNNLMQGEFTISFFVYDTLGNVNDTFVLTLYKDTEPPIITINSPDNSSYWNTRPLINIIIDEQQLDACWYRVFSSSLGWSGNINLANDTDQLLDVNLWNSLDQGVFYLCCYANDSFGYLSDVHNLTLYKDDIIPTLTVNLPLPGYDQWDEPPMINAEFYDINNDTLWYRVYSTSINWSKIVILTNNTDQLLDSSIWNSLGQGDYQLYIYANDTFGNLNEFSQTLSKDTLAPIIINNSPLNFTYWNSAPLINVTVYEPNLGGNQIYYSVDEYPTTPKTLVNNTDKLLDSDIWDNLPQGVFHLRIYCSDRFPDHTGEIVLTLYKDTIAPIITVNSPDNLTYWNTRPIVNMEIDEQQLNESWYRVYSSSLGWSTNINLANNTNYFLDQDIWNNLSQGEFQIHFYANDSFGNLDTKFLTLYKDTLAPDAPLSLTASPSSWTNINDFSLSWSNPSDTSGIAGAFYSLDGIPTHNFDGIFVNGTDIMSILGIIVSGDGIHDVYVWLLDDVGNINYNNSALTQLYLDTTIPTIVIHDPDYNDLYGNETFNFDLTVTDPNLDTTWYCLYTDVTGWSGNITLGAGETNGTIDYNLWEACPNGTVIIRFYSNDTVGNMNFEDVTVYKDSIRPDITITIPILNQVFGLFSPDYDLNIVEPHIYQKWYILINATNPSDKSDTYFFSADAGTMLQILQIKAIHISFQLMQVQYIKSHGLILKTDL